MDFTSILKHLNDHHKSNLEDLCKKFDKAQEVQDVEAIEVDFNGITLRYNQDKIFTIAFNKKADESTIKDTIIQLCLSVKTSLDSQKVKTELEEFMREFRSICLASLHKDNSVVCSYAPLIQDNENYYIYISEVSEHFSSISENPKNIEVMFLQDQNEAPSSILRKRVRFKAEATFIERGEEFDRIYDIFEAQNNHNASFKTIRKMLDFHLIKLHFKEGRFVKGFGEAYDIKNGEIRPLTESNPHTRMPHTKMPH